MKKWLVFLLILIPTVGLFYFGLGRDPRLLPSALVAKQAPDFTLKKLEDGTEVTLRGLSGKPLVLNFWATWCGPCAAEHQIIRELVKEYGKTNLQFYSVLYEDTPENARDFIRRYGAGAPILLDPGLHTSIDYGVSGVPETFFINASGKIVLAVRYDGDGSR